MSEPRVRPPVKIEAGRLIRQDIQARVQAAEPIRQTKEQTMQSTDRAPDEETLALPPMIVTTKRPPDLTPPPKEPKLQEFFRTGTILQNRSGSIRLWMKGDQGLMLTFRF